MKNQTVTITITGPAGSGKTLTAHAIAYALRQKGLQVQLTDDIGYGGANQGHGIPQSQFYDNQVPAQPNIVINVETK